jgi:hypothetical protein
MPRFFFDISDGDDLVLDDEGVELSCIDRAREEAETTLREVARELSASGSLQGNLSIIVRDEDKQLFVVAMTMPGNRSVH